MRIGTAIALVAACLTAACGRGDLFKEYEYEEEIYLALDGSATVYVNSSVAALNALRGSSFDPDPSVQVDRQAVRDWFTTSTTRVTRRPTVSRRNGRRYVHVRLDTDDIAQLPAAAPFAWSSYRFQKDGNLFVYRQTVGAPAGSAPARVNWNGDEIVGFRIHLPSTITYHNAGAGNPRRGNILVWEQPLASRLAGEPMAFDARIESQSILSNTLILFASTGVVVALMFAGIIWWVVRRGGKAPATA